MNGRKKDVLIEASESMDERTGVKTVSTTSFIVWADNGNKEIIQAVEGVSAVYSGQPEKTRYHVYVDHRYDIEWVKCEVEAAILIGGGS